MDKKEKMFLLVDQWRKSGLTRDTFAQQHGITGSKLEYWCRKRDNKARCRTIMPAGFVELISKQEPVSDKLERTSMPKIELELPGGIRIKIY